MAKRTGRAAIVSHALQEIFLDEDAIWLESCETRPTSAAATQMVVRQIMGPGIISLGDLSFVSSASTLKRTENL